MNSCASDKLLSVSRDTIEIGNFDVESNKVLDEKRFQTL